VQRKVIIDCDPGIDDAVALCLALFAPELEILALTATEGCVPADQATVNVHAILEEIDPPKHPRIGSASPAENRPAVDTRFLHGDSGLGMIDYGGRSTLHQHPAEKVIADVVRAFPGSVTIVALGPATNVAKAFQRDPALPGLVDRIILMGGALHGVGNVTAAAEFNMYYDPESARSVFRSRTTKTIIPLDVTRQVTFGIDLLEKLPSSSTRVGRFLRRILPFFFSSFHERLGQELIVLNDAIAMLAVIRPELFETSEMFGDVEPMGEITRGVTVFDRRPNAESRPNMEVAVNVDVDGAREGLIELIRRAGAAS
jgi:inosine-uridine nucleoside N-ribohydrolase